MKSLGEILEKCMLNAFKKSNNLTALETIKFRVLQDCAKCLKTNLNRFIGSHMIYIHPENKEEIKKRWQFLMDQGVKFRHEEYNLYKIINFSDYLHILDIQKFLTILKNKNQQLFLYEILAMDGFKGYNAKLYLENLKYKNENNHIYIIREIYRNMKVPVKIVHFALLHVFEKFSVSLIQERKAKLEKEITFDPDTLSNIIEYYKSNIKNLDNIASVKLTELSIQRKVLHKPLKRNILKEDHRERHPKKRKVSFLSDG